MGDIRTVKILRPFKIYLRFLSFFLLVFLFFFFFFLLKFPKVIRDFSFYQVAGIQAIIVVLIINPIEDLLEISIIIMIIII